MKKSGIYTYKMLALSLVLSAAVVAMVSCGGNNTPTSATTGTVNLSMTDPGTCTSEFKNVYVTVTKVTANINASAGSNDSGWQTIVDLTKAPMQIDLLSLNPTNTCLLKQLGSDTSLPAGKYQQIRLYLLSNSTPNTGSACGTGNGWNCVVTQSGQTVELQLPSEVQTGLKIPSPNIMSGGFTVTAGQSVDLNLDFQSCASIVPAGSSGKYLLKPVLFAGEVSPNMNSISGQVVVGDANGQPLLTSGQPTPIAGATVLFEQPTNNLETVMESATTDQNGNFFLCPLPGSNYDIAVTAQTSGNSGTTTYNPTVAFNVPLGTKLSQLPLVPETVSAASTGGAATIAGQVDTSPTTTSGESVTLTPTMSITPTGGSATDVAIPVFAVNGSAVLASGQPPSVQTTSSPSPSTPACSSGADCYNFSLTVPASSPNVGTFSNGAITYGVQSSSNVSYGLTASAPDACTTTGSDTASSLVVKPDNTTNVTPNLALSGCQ